MKKICTKCRVEKYLTDFYKDSQKKSGLRPDCKTCNIAATSFYQKNNRKEANFRNMKYRTGVSKEQYLNLLQEQEEKCLICGITEKDYGKRLSIDHCHKSYFIRGLLCGKCNQGLGYFDDNVYLFKKAIRYLKNNFSVKEIKYGR